MASTVGAGDSLLAGMLHGLASGWPAERVLRQATAIASLAVTQFEFGIGDPQRLARIEAGVVVQPLVEGPEMKLAIVTACPGGQVTSVLAARLLRGAAERLGWETCVEANAGSRPEGELSAEQIAEADWVLLVGVEPLAAARFVGKPVYRARPAEALADPRAFLQRAAALASVEVAGDEAGLVAPEAGAAPRIVAVTACPTGVAHTFMAAEALQLAAGQLGFALQVETQGSVGARNPLDPADIAAADVVLLAADIDVDTARFAGKKIYRCGTGVALKQARATLERALAEGQVESAGAASAVVARDEKRGVYKHLLTGVSFMLPMVVAGGLLIALSLAFGIDAYKQPGSLAAVLRTVGDTAFVLMVPMLAGYIAYSIADRPGLAPGMLGGLLAGTLGAGFIGGIVAGFIAGYAARAISHGLRLPASLEALKPILVIPLLASLVTGLLMLYVVGKPVAGMLAALTGFLDGMGTSNAILLGLLLGGMMCVDLGGPVNKAAYAFPSACSPRTATRRWQR